MIDGIKITPLKQIFDERGKVMHMLRNDDEHFEQFGEVYFSTAYPGAIKGWHEHTKQVQNYAVVFGMIKLVLYDNRKDSETYGKYFSYILSSEIHESVFIPKGFAHGYLTLSKTAVVNYLVDNYYNQSQENGISYDDEFLNINWGIKTSKIICSKKDKELKPYRW